MSLVTDYLNANIIVGIGMWVIFRTLDHCLTVYSAKKLTILGGHSKDIELNPQFKEAISNPKYISRQFIFLILGTSIGIFFIGGFLSGFSERAYTFFIGMLILTYGVILVRHVTNIMQLRLMIQEGLAIDSTQPSLSYRSQIAVSNVDLLGHCLLFMIVYVSTKSEFVLGGIFGCLAIVLKSRTWKDNDIVGLER